ncbi:MAG: hypothetical protein EOP51_21880, partial [Sphingobacteriales bacterium]
MKKIITLSFLTFCALFSTAQLITPFSIRHQTTQKGGIRFLANGILSCGTGTSCNTGRSEVPPAGTSQNNNFTMQYIDMDGNASTFSSSSDSLALPACSQISWAGLYWGANSNTGSTGYANRFSVKLKVNNGAYSTITAAAANRQDNATGYDSYHAFADITSIVQSAGINARFTVADMFAQTAGTNLFGGWTIVVVYKNDLQPMRNLTVFNGLAAVRNATGSTTVNIPISGFLTPLSGPVTFELGVVAYDGDRSQTGDQLLFNGAGSFVGISDAIHPANDAFNSTIGYNGVLTQFRLPNYNNTLGHDANIFIPNNTTKNYIGNSATSASIRVTTGGETILQQVVTSAIDVYEPDIRAGVRVQDLNGGAVEPGDILEYTVVGKNIGSDPSVNTYITDTIEGNASYVPGSLIVTHGPNTGAKTDAAGDDQAEYVAANRVVKVRVGTGANAISGGQMNNSVAGTDSTVFRFRVQVTNQCLVLQCDNVVNNQAYIFGTGNVSGNTFNNASNPDIFDGSGCPVAGTVATVINTVACTPSIASSNTPVCAGTSINLSTTQSASVNYAWSGPAGFSSAIYNPTVANATAANAGTYNLVVTVPGLTCSINLSTNVTVTPGTSSNGLSGAPGAGAFVETHPLAQSTYYSDVNCNLISRTQSSGAVPVTGSITSTVWVESTVPTHIGQPFVPRHYEITPAQNPATSTGTVTLYFLQSEFDAFNNHPGSILNLPTGPGDAAGIANLRVGQFPGSSSNGSGLPGSYSSGTVITPPGGGIVWNATAGRWEITFPVTGFGGFILQTHFTALPVSWASFTAQKSGEKVLLQWKTNNEINANRFVILHGNDGIHFTAIGTVQAAGNSSTLQRYSFTHNAPLPQVNFYRIEQQDFDGKKNYSDIRK